MKTHVALPWPNTDIAAKKLHDYVKTHTDILTKEHSVNVIDIGHVIQHVPDLTEFFAQHGVTPRVGFFLYSKPNETLLPHVDHGKPKRFLFPVFNCQGSVTEFYKAADDEIVLATLRNGNKFYTVNITPPYTVLDQFELTQPVVLDTGIPHGVFRDRSTNLPRISFTIATVESLDHFLQ